MSRIDRLTNGLYYLSKKSYSQNEVADRLLVSRRTVERYIRFLYEVGCIRFEVADKGREIILGEPFNHLSLPANKIEIREALERQLEKLSESGDMRDDAYFRLLMNEILLQKRYLGFQE